MRLVLVWWFWFGRWFFEFCDGDLCCLVGIMCLLMCLYCVLCGSCGCFILIVIGNLCGCSWLLVLKEMIGFLNGLYCWCLCLVVGFFLMFLISKMVLNWFLMYFIVLKVVVYESFVLCGFWMCYLFVWFGVCFLWRLIFCLWIFW